MVILDLAINIILPISLKPIRIVVLAAWMPLGNSGDIDVNVSGWLSNVKFVNNLISLLPDKVYNSVPFPVKVMSVTQTFSNKVVGLTNDQTEVRGDREVKEKLKNTYDLGEDLFTKPIKSVLSTKQQCP
jgi:hypothetical protein